MWRCPPRIGRVCSPASSMGSAPSVSPTRSALPCRSGFIACNFLDPYACSASSSLSISSGGYGLMSINQVLFLLQKISKPLGDLFDAVRGGLAQFGREIGSAFAEIHYHALRFFDRFIEQFLEHLFGDFCRGHS